MLQYFLFNYYGYYIIFLFLFLFSILSCFNKKKEIKYFIIFSIIVSFFMIFRFDLEFDYVWYWIVGDERFQGYWFYDFAYERVGIFFKFLFKLTRLSGNPKMFFIITGIIFSFLFLKSVNKYAKNKFMAMIIYFYLPSLYFTFLIGFIRQGLAIISCFFITDLLYKKKYLLYIFLIILISLFIHKSTLVCILYVVIYKINNKKYLLLLESIIFFLVFNLEIILKGIPLLKNYTYYLQENLNFSFLGLKIVMVAGILYIFACFLIKVNNLKLSKEDKFYNNLIIFGIGLFILLTIKIGGHVPMRVSSYFFIFFPIFFSNIFSYLRKKRIIELLLIILLFLFSNFNLMRIANKEYKKIDLRNSWHFKLLLFNDYEDLAGKYIPDGKVEYEYKK